MKEDATEGKSPLNGLKECKAESEASLQSEKPTVEDSVITKSQTIKEEPMEVSDVKTSNITASEPAPVSDKSCASRKAEQGEEAKRNTAEELQRAKNDQQAKIPLKKRGMKLSEDFDKSNSSSIVVHNPSIPQVKEPPKVDELSEERKKEQSVNDHVNGDSRQAADKVFHSHLCESNKETETRRNSVDGKEQPAKLNADESKAEGVREKEVPRTVEDGIKDLKDGAGDREKSMEVVTSDQAELDKGLDMNVEKENTTAPEGKEAPVKCPKPEPSPLITESPPLSKDVNNVLVKTPDHEEHGKVNESKTIDTKVAPVVAKTSTLKEDVKSPTSDETEKLDSNHDVVSKGVKSNDSEKSEEKPSSEVTDASELNQTEKPNMAEITENVADPKPTETATAKETGTPEPVAEKADNVTPKEAPEVTKKNEAPSSETDPAKESDDSKKIISPSVIKNTEILKCSNDTESPDKPEDAQNSSVIKKADLPLDNEHPEEKLNTKEAVESSVIKKAESPESFKRNMKDDNLKDTEMPAAVEEEAVAAGTAPEKVTTEEKEKPTLTEDTEKTVNCKEGETDDVDKGNDCTSRPMEVEEVAGKDDPAKPQADDKKEEASDEKNKPPSSVEKENVSEETDKKERAQTEQEKISEEQPHKKEYPTTIQTPKESEKDENKESEKDMDKDDPKVESEKHPCQDRESKGDSTSDELSKTDKATEDEHAPKGGEISSETEKSGRLKVSEEPAGSKPGDKESQGKSEERDSAAKEKEADGGDAPPEAQVEVVRLKSKVLAHRRRAELQREERQADSESDTNAGRSLRRSPRISRPTPKAVEIQDRKLEKLQATPPVEKHEDDKAEKAEEEEEDEEELKPVQKKPKEKKVDQEGQPKSKVRWMAIFAPFHSRSGDINVHV